MAWIYSQLPYMSHVRDLVYSRQAPLSCPAIQDSQT
jgi:hypothetical protein